MVGEELGRHERGVPGVAVGVPRGIADLEQAVVFADVHAGDVNDDFLTDAVVLVQVVAVDRHGDGGGAVLDNEALVYVALLVGRDYASGDDVVRAVLFGAQGNEGSVFVVLHAEDVVGVVLPAGFLEVKDADVGLQGCHRLLRDTGHGLLVEIVLTCCQHAAEANGSGNHGRIFEICFHLCDYFLPVTTRFLISQVSAPSAVEPYLKAI